MESYDKCKHEASSMGVRGRSFEEGISMFHRKKRIFLLLTIGWAKNSGREANEVVHCPMAGHFVQVSVLNKPLLA